LAVFLIFMMSNGRNEANDRREGDCRRGEKSYCSAGKGGRRHSMDVWWSAEKVL
jgi:hypothetical protein